MRLISGLAGLVLLLLTAYSILRTLVVPRGLTSRLTSGLLRVLRVVLRRLAGRRRGYVHRDRFLAWLAPLTLAGTLAVWVLGELAGYALLVYAITPLDLPGALREAGAALFTLGVSSNAPARLVAVDFAAAATGPLIIALQIAYLPSLYAAYNRRETTVTLLQARAGEPAWGPELLARQSLVGTVPQLRELYRVWEMLAVDVGESHANYPVLVEFRSPQPYRSWVVGLLAVLDAAAMHLALCPSGAPPEARLTLRSGFTALRDIARVQGIPFDPDPRPDGPLLLTYQEFAEGVDWAVRAGFPAERGASQAWPHFRGWRVNYEAVAYALARRTDAAPVRWSGDREWPEAPVAPLRPPHRDPDLAPEPRTGVAPHTAKPHTAAKPHVATESHPVPEPPPEPDPRCEAVTHHTPTMRDGVPAGLAEPASGRSVSDGGPGT